LLTSLAFAYDPPAGGESINSFLAASLLGGGTSVAGGAFGASLPAERAVNPAIGADEQRIVLDASYAALIGTGAETGLGHAFNLGILYPTRWSVLAASLNFATSPFASMPLGTAGTARASISKDLTDKIFVGAGLSGSVGTGWGISGDIGMLIRLGAIGFMQDARAGFALTGIGSPFNPGTTGIKGGASTGYPSMFTPRAGIAATFLDTDKVKVGGSFDLSAPTFQNVVLDAGLEARFLEVVTVKPAWTLNLLEAMNGKQSFIPSVAIGVNLKLDAKDKESFLAKNGWGQSDITPTVAVKPLTAGIVAGGAGVNIKLGVTDTNPPAIAITYPETVYISPNDDGTQDALEFPIKITDERDVVAWAFVIKDSTGAVVRTIANKEIRTEMQDLTSVWKLLTKVKQGIPLPDKLRWDGVTDSGEKAPDGTYTFSVTASDDNGNKGTSDAYTVYLDNTAPVVTATPPSGANAMIFSPDGDGNKDTFRIAQTGSKEDLWAAVVTSGAGSPVRTVLTKDAAPADFAWDGKNDTGSIVPDGVYAYSISAKDRAGNTASASVTNIIVDTDKPSINISIDQAAFSPNGDGAKDVVTLAPSVPVITGLIDWTIQIRSRDGTVVRTWTGNAAAKPVAFDGKNDSGSAVAEGDYQAKISARYINGFAPSAQSPYFTLDVTAPEAQVRASGSIFSPVGDGKLDTVTFTQQAGTEPSWTGEIFAIGTDGKISGKAIRTAALGSTPETALVWDGRDDAGKLAGDGKYGYRLSSTDRAGNTGYSNVAVVELNTEKADLILQQSLAAFSPNGDGVKDSIVFTPIVKAATSVDHYALAIKERSGAVVKTMAGTGKIPATFSWNGIADAADGSATGPRVPDGFYTASIEVTLINQQVTKSQAPEFEIDTKFPTIDVSSPFTVFSPNADGNRDTIPVTQTSSEETLWKGTIAGKTGIVKNYSWNKTAGNFDWDATDDSGNKVPDGTYTYSVTSEDRAGNRTTKDLSGIAVDARVPKAYITAELAAFSPNNDTVKDTQKLAIVTNIADGLKSWSVAIKPEGTAPGAATVSSAIKTWDSTGENATANAMPSAINWDGKDKNGAIAHGKYYAELSLTYAKGDAVTAATPAFTVNAKPPVLGVKLAPKYFSPDNDGIDDELFISLAADSISPFAEWSFDIREPEGTNGNVFWKSNGVGKITDRIIWDGRSLKGELVQAATDYPFTFTVKDEVGMTSVVKGYIPIDVLIIRDGDKLKIAVPSIIFRENAADFNGLKSEVVDKNTQVLRRIAEILNKFRDYKVEVEGHANNVTGTQKEEDTELIPLSMKRANAVKDFLVANGVDAARLSSIGMGGTKPVVQRSDKENWWKNRRVEFILIK
jgi:outer membrane protein OmpA-like peptidoglycan-associated protein/flagellar hook assembly protein FlgD